MSGTAHCADLYAPSDNDVPDLVSTRELQNQYIQFWLNQPVQTVTNDVAAPTVATE